MDPVSAGRAVRERVDNKPSATANNTDVFTSGWQATFAALLGRVIILAAVWSLIDAVFRPVRSVRRIDGLFGLLNLPVSPSLFSVVLLFLVGSAVRRRLRVALLLLVAFQIVSALYLIGVAIAIATGDSDARYLHAYDETGLGLNGVTTVTLVVLLWRCRGSFRSRLEQGNRGRALAVLLGGLGSSVVLSTVLTLLFPHHLRDARHRFTWAIRVAFGVGPEPGDVGWRGQEGYHWIEALTGVVSAIALVCAVVVLLRSARAKTYLSTQDELAVRGLLLGSGDRDSLGYFATRHDKSVIFSPARDAALTYRVLAGVSLASADPIGPHSGWAGAVEAWVAEARSYGWYPAVLAASEEGAKAYVAAGLKALPIGDEAIIEVDTFTLQGPSMEPVRRAARRVARAGYTISVHRHTDLTAGQLAEIDQRAEEWRGDDTERGFSMALGRLGDSADGTCVAVLAHDRSGQLRGLLSLVPWGRRGLSLDLMRRDRDSENGLIEAMVAALVQSARDELGVHAISLNFAMFRGIFSAAERVGAGPFVRLTSRVLTFASRFWQIESLYRSNARYLPRWTPRYLCYDSSLSLTRVALAAGMAEGFLPTIGGAQERTSDADVVYQDRVMPFTDAVLAQQRAAERPPTSTPRLSQQQHVRHDKLATLRAAGFDPYPVEVPRADEISDLIRRFRGLAPDTRTGVRVSVTGRVRALRDFGGLTFAVLQEDAFSLQIIADRGLLEDKPFQLFRSVVDLGDHLSVSGEVITSRTGELSVHVEDWQMAAKCLRPLPDTHVGFADPDAKARQRHLDLIVNPDAMAMVTKRSLAIRQIRESFARRQFLEVETPMLQSVHGGANARPFVTHINAYDANLYLRIAPELYLKRLCVGGMRQVFELNRNFRNEGADSTHNPEFTSVEAYQAYSDYLGMRDLTRDLILEVATAIHGQPVARRPDADGRFSDIDLSVPWRSVTVHDAVASALGEPISAQSSLLELRAAAERNGLRLPVVETAGQAITYLYEELVEGRTELPTFYFDFPLETSPLTRQHRRDPHLAERWDLVAFGTEIGTAYSELIDPVDQRQRFHEQSLQAAGGDPEAMQIDEHVSSGT